MNKQTVYFVVSLPRTGTTSLCKMAKICGLSAKHAPSSNFNHSRRYFQHDFYSDTPVYSPSVVESICKNEYIDARFIYIEKEFQKIFDSWVKVGLYENYKKLHFSYQTRTIFTFPVRLLDFLSYDESFNHQLLDTSNFESLFTYHKETIFEIIESYKKQILLYRFYDGWDPFCRFINKPIPEESLPFLNQDTMFDNY